MNMFSLRKYLCHACSMRRLRDAVGDSIVEGRQDAGDYHDYQMLNNLWYAHLYVVIEGWLELGLAHTQVNKLITTPNTSLLKAYRNAVFHFQKSDKFWKKTDPFVESELNPIQWAEALVKALDEFFDVEILLYNKLYPDAGFC